MLYINVFLVGQRYGGPEEGGWYYPVGTPLASIPVDSDYQPGKCFYLSDVRPEVLNGIHKCGVVIKDCDTCSGTGNVLVDPDSGSEVTRRCQDCGLIPDNCEAVWKEIQKWQDYFKDLPGHLEDIQIILQEGFAEPFGTVKPHYE